MTEACLVALLSSSYRGHVHAYNTPTHTHTHTHTGMMGMDGLGGMEDMWRTMYEGMRQMYERGGDVWGQQSGVFSIQKVFSVFSI